nr:PREDICTED: cyclic nucleotide-gated ion channel 1-like isoform X2 [Fragaria vesca subsp. vesca]
MHRWNTLFIIVCAFAVFVDPLFCYIHVVEEDYTCFDYDFNLFWIYCGLRTACDAFYVIDIIIFLCGICKKRKGKIFVSCGKPSSEKKRALPLKEIFRKRCLLPLSILPRILVSLPIPAVLLGLIIFLASNYEIYLDPFFVIIIITPFQYTLRIFLIYGSQRWRPIKKTTRGRWLKPLLDFLPFILASHLFGALWYRLAIQRHIDCWKSHCQELTGKSCCSSFNAFECGTTINAKRVQELCPTKVADPKIFDIGIYSYAVQSNVTCRSSHLLQRMSLSFWWALRNLSSFGSNLNTSMDTLENFFSIVISICGMALFLVYLNARVQESQSRSNQHKLKEKKQLMKPDIDLWLSKNDLSHVKITTKESKDLKTTMKKKTLKTVIIENIDKLEENKDIDLQNIINVLPIKFKKTSPISSVWLH